MPKIAAGATNKNISIAPHGTGKVVVGTGAADATVQSDGEHNLILQTGNSTTGKIEIADGANGNIDITPNGTGEVDIPKVDIDGGTVDGITLGTNSAVTEAQIDNLNIDGNAITSTNDNGNIDLTPNGTGEVNISKVDIDGGAIDGTNVTVGSEKTLDVSAGTLTTSTAQKQAIVDGAAIEGDEILATGESGTFLGADGDDSSSWKSITGTLPSQSGNVDRLLTTDGTDASWTNAPINLVKLAFAGQSSAPGSPSAGTVYYNSTDDILQVWDDTSWVPLGAVIQVVAGAVVDGSTTKSATYSDWEQKPTPYVEITPTSASNKIFISGAIEGDNASDLLYIDIYRSGTGVTDGRVSGDTGGLGYYYNNDDRSVNVRSVSFTDSLSGVWTSDAIKYQYSFRASASAAVVLGAPNVSTMLTAMEIKG